jgi:hypothetical protein
MGVLSRIVGRDTEDLVEIEIVGEGFRQEVIGRVAGPKQPEGKEVPIGLTFRCEPTSQYDRNAVRVECLGELIGYVARDIAARLAPPIQRVYGGALEGRGLVVGGRHDGRSGRDFGVRGWITTRQAATLGLDGESLVYPQPHGNLSTYPSLPDAGPAEERLTPIGPGSLTALPTDVRVTCEEHYQSTIIASKPTGYDGTSWTVLVDLGFAPNPHTTSDNPVVEVRIGDSVVGYFTAAMSERHRPTIQGVKAKGLRPTASATVRHGKKAETELLRLHLGLRMPDTVEVSTTPKYVINTHTSTVHAIGELQPDCSWRAQCCAIIPAYDAVVLCVAHPTGLLIDAHTHKVVAIHKYGACGRCDYLQTRPAQTTPHGDD